MNNYIKNLKYDKLDINIYLSIFIITLGVIIYLRIHNKNDIINRYYHKHNKLLYSVFKFSIIIINLLFILSLKYLILIFIKFNFYSS